MTIKFPKDFVWGTSTAAAQIETAFEHDWKGVVARDGYTFERTSDHELRRLEDLEYIVQLGNAYRMSLDWSRLQREPFAKFDPAVVMEYASFMAKLKARGVKIMLVLHHFCNPLWFVKAGSWENSKTLPMFLDYVVQVVRHFGRLVDSWNTFNEPGVYMANAYAGGLFPPFKKSLFAYRKVLKNMSRAHRLCIPILKRDYFDKPIGISKNTVIFTAENFLGRFPAKFADKFFMEEVTDRFVEGLDYLGMSYYAKISFDPKPITEVDTPGKLAKMKRPHDKMWEYYPKGIKENILRFWKRYNKPIIITENGICTDDCQVRIQSLKDYLGHIYDCIVMGVDIRGYYHWTTLDNFEWNLGPTYRFGLVHVDFVNGKRTMKESGLYYQQIVRNNGIIEEVEDEEEIIPPTVEEPIVEEVLVIADPPRIEFLEEEEELSEEPIEQTDIAPEAPIIEEPIPTTNTNGEEVERPKED